MPNDCLRLSRRAVLAAASAVVSPAVAQQKLSPTAAKYQSTPKGDHACDGCISFQPPNGCRFVRGDISPSGWCQLFYRKPA